MLLPQQERRRHGAPLQFLVDMSVSGTRRMSAADQWASAPSSIPSGASPEMPMTPLRGRYLTTAGPGHADHAGGRSKAQSSCSESLCSNGDRRYPWTAIVHQSLLTKARPRPCPGPQLLRSFRLSRPWRCCRWQQAKPNPWSEPRKL
jgi:hypothetical protein